jgi:hypothetical protein
MKIKLPKKNRSLEFIARLYDLIEVGDKFTTDSKVLYTIGGKISIKQILGYLRLKGTIRYCEYPLNRVTLLYIEDVDREKEIRTLITLELLGR